MSKPCFYNSDRNTELERDVDVMMARAQTICILHDQVDFLFYVALIF